MPFFLVCLSRWDRFLPILQNDVCFLRLPPDFPAVPQYFNHVSAWPYPLTEQIIHIMITEKTTSMITEWTPAFSSRLMICGAGRSHHLFLSPNARELCPPFLPFLKLPLFTKYSILLLMYRKIYRRPLFFRIIVFFCHFSSFFYRFFVSFRVYI